MKHKVLYVRGVAFTACDKKTPYVGPAEGKAKRWKNVTCEPCAKASGYKSLAQAVAEPMAKHEKTEADGCPELERMFRL